MQGMDELKKSLWCTKFELETIRAAAQEEIARKEEEIKQLKELLGRAVKERDEAAERYQALIRQQQQRQQQQDPSPAPAAKDDGWSEESMVCESPAPYSARAEAARPLPEKGKLLQAVMKAGPLLQTLLLAGPLPQWRRPPPPLDGVEIPPVTMPAAADGKLDRCVGAGRKRSNTVMIGTHECDVGEGEWALQPCTRRRSELVVCKASPPLFLT